MIKIRERKIEREELVYKYTTNDLLYDVIYDVAEICKQGYIAENIEKKGTDGDVVFVTYVKSIVTGE